MLENIFIVLGVSVAINLFFFLIAFILKKDLFTDITYAATFLLTTLITMIINQSFKLNHWIIFGLILLWSLRLGAYLFIRILKIKVDHRFDNIRSSFVKFGAFWLLQAITVWLVNMPGYIVILDQDQTFNWYLLIPIVFALGFLSIETIADFQKFIWYNKNKGKIIDTGLWKYSRHPNYFGEFSFWWMLMVFALLGNYKHENLISLIGPLYITFTLYKVSGLPLLEKRTWKQFKNNTKYLEYIKKTPTMIPFIGKKGIKESWKSL